MDWSDFEPDTWRAVRTEAMAGITPVETPIFASDQHPGAVRQTMEGLEGADVESLVQVKQADFFKLEPRTDGGMLVFNPPYGERMDPGDVVGLYERIGDRLKFHWSGFDAWVISSNDEALKRVGLRPHKRHPCSTGPSNAAGWASRCTKAAKPTSSNRRKHESSVGLDFRSVLRVWKASAFQLAERVGTFC